MAAAGNSCLSIVEPPENGSSCSSTVGVSLAARVDAVNRQRIARKWSHEELCRRAGIQLRNWHDIVAGKHTPKEATVAKAERACAKTPPQNVASVIAGVYRLAVTRLCKAHRFPIETFDAQDLKVQKPRNPNWLAAARINRMAIYLLTVELEMQNVDVARALDCTRGNVHAARAAVFDWLEQSPRTHRLLSKVTLELAGRAA